jgi:hypothetical protein
MKRLKIFGFTLIVALISIGAVFASESGSIPQHMIGSDGVESGIPQVHANPPTSDRFKGKICPARVEYICKHGLVSKISYENGCKIQSCVKPKRVICPLMPEKICGAGTISNTRLVNGCKVQSCDIPNQNQMCPMYAIMCGPGQKVFYGENCKQTCVLDTGIIPTGQGNNLPATQVAVPAK